MNIKRVNDDFYNIVGNGLLSEFIPYLRPFYYHKELQLKSINKKYLSILKSQFQQHKNTYSDGLIRDFTDSVIWSQQEAIKEDASLSKYFKDDNLMMAVSDLFLAATDTSQTTLRWMVLLMANYPDLQQRMFQEITDAIGDRMPVQEDKSNLPFTCAFIKETLRFRTAAPIGLDHESGVDSSIGGYTIPKRTRILFYHHHQNHDEKYWKNPSQFDPERFIENGKLKVEREKSFVSFGLGKRSCIGERMAYTNLMLILVGLIQKLKFELPDGPGSANLEPINVLISSLPRDYQIICSKRMF